MKKIIAICLICTQMLALAACGLTNERATTEKEAIQTTQAVEEVSESMENSEEKAETKIVVDHAGVEVEVPTKIDRIVVGNTLPLASVLTVYLGSAEKIVGLHPASMGAAKSGLLSELYSEILDAKTEFINGTEINVEELLLLNPDIVIGVGAEQAQILRDAGIPAITVSVSNWNYDVVETYHQWISLFDDIFGENEMTQKISAYSKEAYEMIQERVSDIPEEERKRVMILFNYSEETISTSGPVFFGQFWCDAVGAVNVAGNEEGMGNMTIDMEQVYEWDPEMIIITNFTSAIPDDLYNNTIGEDDWSKVSAIKNKQVYKMPLGLYRTYTPGADTPVTLRWFAKTVYPELFEDVDIEQITDEYFKEFHNITLTEEQITGIFTPNKEGATGL